MLNRCERGALAALLVLAAILAAPDAPAPAAPATAAATAWPSRPDGADTLVETPHYRIRTDLGDDVGQLVGSQQEVLYAELARRMGAIKPAHPPDRLEVLVVGTQAEYRRRLGETAAGSKGLFLPGKQMLAVWGAKDEMDVVLESLRHEGTHQFIACYIGPSCPVWLNEGLAVFYEHGRFVDGKLELGGVPAERLVPLQKAAAENRLIPVAALLAMTDAEWLANVNAGEEKSHVQYGEAWSIVHYLANGDGGKHRSALEQYLYYISRNLSSKQAWDNAFGPDVAGFERRWRDYIQTLKAGGGADDVCREHLEILGALLARGRDKPGLWKDMETFHQSVLAAKFGSLKIRLGALELKTTDRRAMEALFHCPLDKKGAAAPSYELSDGKPGELPVLRCRLHSGLVLETAYEKDAKGELEAKVVAKPGGTGGR